MIHRTLCAALCALLGAQAAADTAADRKLSYYFGYQMGKQLADFQENGFHTDLQAATDGLRDALAGRASKIGDDEADTLFDALNSRIQAAKNEQAADNRQAGNDFLANNRQDKAVKTTASGLQYRVKRQGKGAPVRLGDEVRVSYKGSLPDGTVFDQNADFTFTLQEGQFVAGWLEGLRLMRVGGSYTLYVPADLGYGDMPPVDDIPAGSTLIFDIDVLQTRAAARGKRKK